MVRMPHIIRYQLRNDTTMQQMDGKCIHNVFLYLIVVHNNLSNGHVLVRAPTIVLCICFVTSFYNVNFRDFRVRCSFCVLVQVLRQVLKHDTKGIVQVTAFFRQCLSFRWFQK